MMAKMTRRAWLKASSSLAALSLLDGCGSGGGADADVCEPDGGPGPVLPSGYVVATFELRDKSAIVWVAAPSAMSVRVLVAETENPSIATEHDLVVSDDSLAAWVEIGGLAPNTCYSYAVDFESGAATRVHFRTAPSPSTSAPIRFHFSADVGPDEDLYDIFDVMLGRRPDFYLNLGDWPYADSDPAARTIEQYREKYAAVRGAAAIGRFLRGVPVCAIYDDHEVYDNWDAAAAVESPDRFMAAMLAWEEQFPLTTPPGVRYRNWRWGKHLEVFVLDTRRHRSPRDAVDDATKTMLGSDQKAWLIDGLARSDATFKLVITSVPFCLGYTVDDWSSYLRERDEIIASVVDGGIDGVAMLTADRHWFEVRRHSESGILECQVGPLAAGLGAMPEVQPPEVSFRTRTRNFGEIEITTDDPPRIIFRCFDAQGAILYEEEPGV
jgi:alkaline phosphatase D